VPERPDDDGGKLLLTTSVTLIAMYVFLRFIFPTLAAWIVSAPDPLPIPGFAFLIYFGLTFVGVAIFVTTSDVRLSDFATPIERFLIPGGSSRRRQVRMVVLVAVPLIGAYNTYAALAPSSEPPTESRLQHPTIPGEFEKLESEARHPGEEAVHAFAAANGLEGATPEAKAALIAANMEEGRVLYMINCRPCHGTKADGVGPMARGFRLKPANFTDPGTIATLVEPYLLWRVRTGGIGLPGVAAPWDSAMPRWGADLSDEQIWKIILAEYDIGAVEPRLPETME
jgi:mono/diheme cytochrome c family protein